MFDSVIAFLTSHSGDIGKAFGVLFMVLAVISKGASTEKAGPIIAKIQGFFDGLAKAAQVVADLLASILKSNGFLGKK